MSPFIGESMPWVRTGPGPSGHGRDTAQTLAPTSPGHPPVPSTDHRSGAVTISGTPEDSTDGGKVGSGPERESGPGIGGDGNLEEIIDGNTEDLNEEITDTPPIGPLFSTMVPPEFGGGREIISVASSVSNTGLSQEGVLHSPGSQTFTGTGGLEERDQLSGITPTTISVPVGEHAQQTGREILIGILSSIGGAVICGLGIYGCCYIIRSQRVQVLSIQARHRLDDSYQRLRDSLRRVPNMSDPILADSEAGAGAGGASGHSDLAGAEAGTGLTRPGERERE